MPYVHPRTESPTTPLSARRARTFALGAAVLIGALTHSTGAEAQGGTPIGGGFSLEPVVEGLDLGVGFASAPDGALFIAQKGGVVRILRDGVLLPDPFIDLSAEVNNTSDRGLLGIAVHPQFPSQPYVYLLYTYDPPETVGGSGLSGPDGGGARVARLLRVTADAGFAYDRAATDGRVVLWGTGSTWANIGNPSDRNDYASPSCGSAGAYVRDCLPADELSHTIGTVTFGPDGMLYAGNGDGCDYTRSQTACTRSLDVDSMSGKIVRIDPITGDAPSDNPFFDGDPQSNRSKVYQLGLRNPFRFAFDAQSGDLYVGDVGWNTWEEVNRGGPGANFGWPCYEGGSGSNVEQPQYRDMSRCAALRDSGEVVVPAIHAYTHAGTSSSVQAGDVYHGDVYPPEYQGALFYSDYNKQELRVLHFDGAGNVVGSETLAVGIAGMVQITAEPGSGDMLIMRITTGTGGPGSVIERLHYDAPEPGLLADGVYTLEAELNGACIQAYPSVTRRVWFWTVTDPAYVETASCADVDAQKWMLEDTGGGTYTLRSESQADYLGVSGGSVVPLGSASSDTLWRFITASNGLQLIHEATGQCLATQSSAVDSSLALAACQDATAQRFVLQPDGNLPPTIAPIADQLGNVGDDVSLPVSASDPEGAPLTFSASGLPDGLAINDATGEIVGQLAVQGDFDVVVRVSDGFSSASTPFLFQVIDDRVPVVTLLEPAEGTLYSPGDVVAFSAEAVDWQGVPLPPESLDWVMYVHHQQHLHFDGLPPTTGAGGSFVADDHGDNTWLELCVTATDDFDRQAQECREIHPWEVDYTIDSVPSGLTIPWEGVPRVTPFTVTTHVGAVRDLSAPLSQPGYAFVSWSDGGAATHPIVIGSAPATFVATYESTGPVPGSYAMRAEHSDKCLQYFPATYLWIFQTAPARFAQYPCDGGSAQQIALQDNGDGSFRLSSSGGVLGISGGSTASGAAVVPQTYDGSNTQRWVPEAQSFGYAFRNLGSNHCLAVQNASTADNAGYVQVTCSGSPAEHFSLD